MISIKLKPHTPTQNVGPFHFPECFSLVSFVFRWPRKATPLKISPWSQLACYSYVILFALRYNVSCLKANLDDIQNTCRWLRSVSWEFSIRCSLCLGIADPTSGLCVRRDQKGCVHEDYAHYLPLRDGQYYCPRAKGQEHIIPEKHYKEWRRVSMRGYHQAVHFVRNT